MTRSMLLVMDMINDLTNQDAAGAEAYLDFLREHRVLEHTKDAISAARAAEVPVGFVRIGFSAHYGECPASSRVFAAARKNQLFKLGTWGTEVHPDLDRRPHDYDFVKHRVSPFYGTDLELVLRTLGVERVYLAGVATNGVVHSGAREGHDRDFHCLVLRDCCGSPSDDEQDAALRCIGRYGDIVDSDQVAW